MIRRKAWQEFCGKPNRGALAIWAINWLWRRISKFAGTDWRVQFQSGFRQRIATPKPFGDGVWEENYNKKIFGERRRQSE
jgi:hypothetical protein